MDRPRPKKVIACHQPVYLPFAGFFAKMARADEFVTMDFVQLNKRSWQVRNQIKTRDGVRWLSVPVQVKGLYHQKIRDVRIQDDGWRRKHWETIRHNYNQAPYFNLYAPFFEETYRQAWERLVDLNLHLIEGLRGFLGITTPMASVPDDALTGAKTDLILSICRARGADGYLSSDGEAAYIEEDKFERAGVRHYYLRYAAVPYPQLHGDFAPHLSAIDLLFNCGPASADVVRRVAPPLTGYEINQP